MVAFKRLEKVVYITERFFANDFIGVSYGTTKERADYPPSRRQGKK